MYFGLNLSSSELTFLEGVCARDCLDHKDEYDIILFKTYRDTDYNFVYSRYFDVSNGVRVYSCLKDLLAVETALAEARENEL